MYRQIIVDSKQCKLQRILWRFSPTEDIQTYELQTVTYGEASSAFLAIRCLHQAARDMQHQFPRAAEIIQRDFYVDDLLIGGNEYEELLQIRSEINQILCSAKFELHKWKSNNNTLTESSRGKTTFEIRGGTRILGQLWDTQFDTFCYTTGSSEQLRALTKKQVLSCISQIFDPLGLLSPVITQAKVILQKLWQMQLDWDESLPLQLHTRWMAWHKEISHLNHLRIPRRILCDKPTQVELHGFCDASEQAYSACIYIRSVNATQQQYVKLLCAKSRVAPLKTLSLPRLELCGALLLARLYKRVLESLTIKIDNAYFWCDSMVALSWIAGEPSRWSAFVANRTAEIQELATNGTWHHIRSELNPADIISRGMNPGEIQECKLWWSGPSILREEYNEIINLQGDYKSPRLLCTEELPEQKRRVTAIVTTSKEEPDFINKFSSLTRLKRTIAYCFRFSHNSRHKIKQKESQIKGPLQVQELERSLRALLSIAQKCEFAKEIHQLSQGREISPKSKILSLHPFIHTDGLLRVGGRLQESAQDYDQKHPIILPKKHHLTHLILMREHLRNLHAGTQALLSIVRTKYWPISGKNTVKKVLHKCIVCCRFRAAPIVQLMGNLPASRVLRTPPFSKNGVDYAGPFSIKISRNKTGKAYLCVFVRFATKAVHLEIVSDLSTAAFLNALKRFIARRGKCLSIHSDNGTICRGQ